MTDHREPDELTKDLYIDSSAELCEQLSSAATSATMDPSHLMRITALGVSHCIAGISLLLEQK